MRAISAAITKTLLLTGLVLVPPLMTAHAETHSGDGAFQEAVKAVKERDYSRALNLFEHQATEAKHDAQYNMAVLLPSLPLCSIYVDKNTLHTKVSRLKLLDCVTYKLLASLFFIIKGSGNNGYIIRL